MKKGEKKKIRAKEKEKEKKERKKRERKKKKERNKQQVPYRIGSAKLDEKLVGVVQIVQILWPANKLQSN